MNRPDTERRSRPAAEELRVLYVDDDVTLADVVAAHLEREDDAIDTATATSARQGLAALSEQDRRIDCVVSDYDMPGMDGLQFLEAIRAEYPDLPFILFTGHGSEEIASRAISAGVTDYLRKGSGTEQYALLAHRIRNAIARHRVRHHEHHHARYRAVFEGAMDAMVITDDDGEYVDANRSACDLFGLPREELLGRRIADFAPDDYDFQAAWEQFQDSNKEYGRFPLVRPDGERRVVEYAASADIVPGEHLSILRDITERDRLETQLRTERGVLREMYRISADRTATFEAKLGRLLDLGREFLDLPYGFLTEITTDTQRIVEARGDHDRLQTGASCPLSEAYCRKTIEREELVAIRNAVEEGWTTDPAYQRFDLGCYIGAKVLVGDELYGTFCFAGTEPRKAAFSEMDHTFVELLARWASYELERRRITDELQHQNERLEDFASVVSHDLRNPLVVADGYLDLAREEGDPEHFDQIETALDRMGQLIDDLLALARAGEEIGETEAVDLRDAVDASWSVVADEQSDAAVAASDDLGRIIADPDRLRQLLENLFRNAVEHSSSSPREDPIETDGPDVTVRVEPLETGFAIADDGPGIPDEVRGRVFDRGFSTRDGGSGFGLYIVNDVVDAHDWNVAVGESETGGARFEITGIEFE